MRGVGISDLVAVGRRWITGLPRWPFLLAGLLLSALGQAIQAMGGLRRLESFAEDALDQIGRVSPFELSATYLDRLKACTDLFDIYGAYVRTECRGAFTADPDRILRALRGAVSQALADPNLAGLILSVAALALGFALCWRLTRVFGDEGFVLRPIVAAILTPLAGSLVAFVLQIAGIVFFTVFGAVVGFLLWFATALAYGIAVFRVASEAHGTARTLQGAADTLRRPPPPPG